MAGIDKQEDYPWREKNTVSEKKSEDYPWRAKTADADAEQYPWREQKEHRPLAEPQEKSSLLRRGIGDPLISLAKGAIVGLPQAIIGIADIPTMGHIGKSIDYITQKALGGTLSDLGERFDEALSPETQLAKQKVEQTEGFFPTVAEALQNPSSIVSTTMESLPQMFGGAGLGRMALKGAGKAILGRKALAEATKGLSDDAAKALVAQNMKRAFAAGAVGEGAISAGQNVNEVRQQMLDGTITPVQALLLTGSGVVTGLITRMSAGLANRMGIADFDAMMQGVWTGAKMPKGVGTWTAMKAVLKGLSQSALVEGAFEELPQEAQETMASNIALGRPTMEGVAEAAAMGMLAGALMGFVAGGTNVARNLKNDPLQQDIENQLREADPEGVTSTPQSEAEKEKAIAAVERIIAAEGASRETPINLPEGDIIPAPKELPLPAGMGEGFTFKDTPQDIIKRPPYTVGEANPNLGVEYKPIMASNGKPFKTEATANAALKSKKLTGKYVVTAVDGGFALTRKTEAAIHEEVIKETEAAAKESGNLDESPTKISPLTIERAAKDETYRVEEVKREDGTTEYRLINDELGFNKWLAPEQAVELFNLRKAATQEVVAEEKVEPQVVAPQAQAKEETKVEAPKKLYPEELQKQADDLEGQYEAAFDDYNDALETGKPPEERAKIKQRLDALEIESQKAIEAAQAASGVAPKPKKVKTAAEAKQKIAEKKKVKEAVPKAAPQAEVKEPWEITKKDYIASVTTGIKALGRQAQLNRNIGKTYHKQQIRKAIAEGKPVPAEVLKDYPDLVKPAKTESAKIVTPKETPIAKTKKKVSEQKESVKEKPVEKTKEKVAAKKATEQAEAQIEKVKKKIVAKKEAQQPSAVEQKSQQEAAATPAGKPKTFQEFLISKGLIYNEEVRKAQYPSKKLEELNKKKLKELGKTVAQLSEEWKNTQGPVTKFAIGRETAPPFFSQLYNVVTTKLKEMPSKVQSIPKWLERQNVKPAEMKWMGVEQWLNENSKDGVIDKEAFAQYLKDNQVQIKEVTKGTELEQRYKDLMEKANEAYDKGLYDKANGYRIEAEAIDKKGLTSTKFAQYQLPGGENYRELLLTLPVTGELPEGITIEKTVTGKYAVFAGDVNVFMGKGESYWDTPQEAKNFFLSRRANNTVTPANIMGRVGTAYRSPHWDEPNVLAHVRMNDRTDSDGKKVLFLEEVQSDWHQEGKRKGYNLPPTPADIKVEPLSEGGYGVKVDGQLMYESLSREDSEKAAERMKNNPRWKEKQGVPAAPLSKTWHELVLKRMLRYAAENGYDKIAWTTGEQQADRYDLSKKISKVDYHYGTMELEAFDLDGTLVINETGVDENKLADYVGKEAAEKLMAQTGRGRISTRTLSGLDLKVGGEGMKAFYDELIPGFMNRYVKQWGAKVGETPVIIEKNISEENWEVITTPVPSVNITPQMRADVLEKGQAYFSEGRAEAIGNIVRGRSLYDALKKEGPYVNHSIIVNPDGSVTATKGKSSVTIEMVKEIKVTEPKDLKGFEEEYNKPYGGQKIFGAYYKTKDGSRAIKFIEQDGVWTLWHETTHLLKEVGLMTPQDEAAVAAMFKRQRPGQKFDEHTMANFIAGQMEQRNWDRDTAFGRFMQKLADFIDSLANLVYRTGRGVIRDMESGEIWNKGEKPVDLTEEAQFSAEDDLITEARKYKTAEEFVGAQNNDKITVYRGINAENIKQTGSKYWTPSKEWAKEFTQTGQEKEVRQLNIPKEAIYKAKEIPFAGDETSIDRIIKEAQDKGYNAIWVSEGKGQPNSVFTINPSKSIRVPKSQLTDIWNKAQEGKTKLSTGRPGEPTNPPDTKDPRTLERHLRDDSAALYKTIVNTLHPKNMTTTEMLLNSPEFWQNPELAKIVNLFARDKSEIQHMTFNDLNAVEDPNTEESTVSEAAKKLRWKGIGLADRLRGKVSKEYQMMSDFLTQADSDPDMVQTLKAFDYKGRLKYFEDYMKKHGATPDVIRVWKLYRDSYDKALDMRTQELKYLIDQMTEEAVAQGEDLNIKELKNTLKYALAEMEGWKGLYAPRVRSRGEWVVQMYKEHGPLEENREWFRNHATTQFGAQKLAKKMEALGWKVWNIGDIEKLPESVYQDTKMISTSKLIDAALKRLEATEGNMVLQFRKELLQQVADEMRARGFRSHMIKRREGYGAVQGFNTDAMERHLVYISNLSSGIAKARVARQATETLNGRMVNGKREGGIDPQTHKKEWRVATDYLKEQLRNQEKIDRMIGIAKSIATFKYLGFNLRALGVNMTALATTAPANIHQQALDGKGSMIDVLRALGGGMKDYISFMRGKKLKNPLDQKFLEEQHKKGHDDPAFMREAMGTVDKLHSRIWGKIMDASMWLFGKTEQFNRGATMLAAFRLGYKKAISEGLSQDTAYAKAAESAIMSSNRAHGVYGKATDPYMAMGNNPSAKMFQMLYVYMKFPHTYLQSMYDMGFRKKNIKGALWAMLSPMVVAGAAVFPFKDIIFGFARAILKALDDDRDPEKFVWDVIREHVGDTGEATIRHGLTGLAGVDISGSLAIGVGLPKNLLDLTGAIGGVYGDIADFGEHLGRGEMGKAAEKLLPTGLASPFRAKREAEEGVTTKRGFRVWTDKDKPYYPTAKATATRALGFRGTEQAILAERTWEGKRQQQNINKRRTEVYAKFRHWALGKRDKDDYEDIRQDIKDFNSFIIKNKIRGESLISSATLKAQLKRITKPTKKERAIL